LKIKNIHQKQLWRKLELGAKRHNTQMNVVLALWENNLIKNGE
jgi:hypothetical protein